MAVRGSRPRSCALVNASPALKIGFPLRTSVGPALTASVTDPHVAGNGMRTVIGVPTGSALNAVAAAPRATRTAPSGGIVVLSPAPSPTMVPTRSWRGAAGGNGCSTTVKPLAAGVRAPHTGVNSDTAFARGGSFSWAIGYQTLSGPCQRPNHGTLSACSVAA